MNRILLSVCLSGLLFVAVGAEGAVFTSESAFQAAASGVSVENFDSLGDDMLVGILPSLGIEFIPGMEGLPGTGSAVSGPGTVPHSGALVLNNRDVNIGSTQPYRFSRIDGGTITAVGFWNTSSDDPMEIRLFDVTGAVFDSYVVPPGASAVFGGIVSTVGAASVEIAWTGTGGNGNMSLDDLQVANLAPKSTVGVDFSNPVVNSGPLSFGLSALPASPSATFGVGDGTPTGGGVTSYGLGDVLSANFVFGDGTFVNLTAFDMQVQANGAINSLSYSFAAINTPTVADGPVVLNSPLFITGTDIASGNAFSYTYANSVEIFTPSTPPAVPGLSVLGIAGLTLLVFSLGGWMLTWRSGAFSRA